MCGVYNTSLILFQDLCGVGTLNRVHRWTYKPANHDATLLPASARSPQTREWVLQVRSHPSGIAG